MLSQAKGVLGAVGLVACLTVLPGCPGAAVSMGISAVSAVVAQVEALRQAVKEQPADADRVKAFVGAIKQLAMGGKTSKDVDLGGLSREAEGYVSYAVAAVPEKGDVLFASSGGLRAALGDIAGAKSAFRASMDTRPNLEAVQGLAPIYVAEGDNEALQADCRAVYESGAVSEEQSLHALLTSCASSGDLLAWVKPEDRAWFQGAGDDLRSRMDAASADARARMDAAKQ